MMTLEEALDHIKTKDEKSADLLLSKFKTVIDETKSSEQANTFIRGLCQQEMLRLLILPEEVVFGAFIGGLIVGILMEKQEDPNGSLNPTT